MRNDEINITDKKHEVQNVTDYLSKIFKLLGDQSKLKILFAVYGRQKSVSEIMNETDLPQTLVSFHLKSLREANVLKAERKATFIYYSLKDERIIEFILSFLLLDDIKLNNEELKQFQAMCNPQEILTIMKGVFNQNEGVGRRNHGIINKG